MQDCDNDDNSAPFIWLKNDAPVAYPKAVSLGPPLEFPDVAFPGLGIEAIQGVDRAALQLRRKPLQVMLGGTGKLQFPSRRLHPSRCGDLGGVDLVKQGSPDVFPRDNLSTEVRLPARLCGGTFFIRVGFVIQFRRSEGGEQRIACRVH